MARNQFHRNPIPLLSKDRQDRLRSLATYRGHVLPWGAGLVLLATLGIFSLSEDNWRLDLHFQMKDIGTTICLQKTKAPK